MTSGETWTAGTREEVEALLGYKFQHEKLLMTAFTHTSYANHTGEESNERLEFLGDAVLSLVVTEKLMRGDLTELRKQYVSRDALTESEGRLNLMRYLRRMGGDNNIAGKTNSNLFEAVIGAIYLDGGLPAAKAFLEEHLVERESVNYKTILQEYVQERQKAIPRYHVHGSGTKFECTVSALGAEASGMGASKKAAETAAAKALLKKLRKGTKS